MALTGAPDGPPRWAPGAVASAAIGAGLVLEGLSPRLASAGLDWAALLGERAALFGHTRAGRRTSSGAARLFEARDGWLAIGLPRPDDWRLVPAWLQLDLSTADFETEAGWNAVADALRIRAVDAIVDRARLIGLACAPAPREPIRDAPFLRVSHASQGRPRDGDRPLRVLDLSSLWAGPLATSLLAQAGAHVLKIESPRRPDGARQGPEAFFDLMHAGKQGIALDLERTQDRAAFEALLDGADVVVESARPRALRQLGYDAAGWVGGRAGRLWLSITGYGRAHEWIAFGDDAAIAAGLGWGPAPGTSDGNAEPCFCGDALADPLAGLHAAAAVLAFAKQGRGALLDVSLRDVSARSAALPLDTAGLSLEREGEGHTGTDLHAGWHVTDGTHRAPVAAPRARAPHGAAPPLAPPGGEGCAAWSDAGC